MPTADDALEIDRTLGRFCDSDLRIETYVPENKVFAVFRIVREIDRVVLGEYGSTYALNSWLDGYIAQVPKEAVR